MLEELTHVGAVDSLRDSRLCLVQRAYIPKADENTKLDILGTDVTDLMNAIEHNLDCETDTPFYQRKVAYDNLPIISRNSASCSAAKVRSCWKSSISISLVTTVMSRAKRRSPTDGAR